jgi:putative hydrolase
LLKEVLVGRLAEGARPSALELLRTLTIGVGRQWKAIGKLQAAMTVLEGYGNLVMDEVGRRHLPNFALLERAYRRRQEQRPPLERAFLRLTGMEMKMKQYVQGERFCRTVLQARGPELLARLWEGPDSLPTTAEISQPVLWMERMARGAASAASRP